MPADDNMSPADFRERWSLKCIVWQDKKTKQKISNTCPDRLLVGEHHVTGGWKYHWSPSATPRELALVVG
jgi:hypothetical protein